MFKKHSPLVDHERRRIVKELTKRWKHFSRKLSLNQGRFHQFNPPVPRRLIHLERRMAHAQARVPASLRIVIWPTKSLDEKLAQPHLGPGHVALRVKRAKDVVAGHTSVERTDEPMESIVADQGIDLGVQEIRHTAQVYAAGVSGGEPLALPRSIRLPRVKNSIVQPARPALPELHGMRNDAKAAPEFRKRHRSAGETLCQLLMQPL
jgi:hypothetical protein